VLFDKQSSQRFIPPLPRIVGFEKKLPIGRCIHGNLPVSWNFGAKYQPVWNPVPDSSKPKTQQYAANTASAALQTSNQHGTEMSPATHRREKQRENILVKPLFI